jgi:tartrate dehydratase beta subunit/fumarate hydratase class I family protein
VDIEPEYVTILLKQPVLLSSFYIGVEVIKIQLSTSATQETYHRVSILPTTSLRSQYFVSNAIRTQSASLIKQNGRHSYSRRKYTLGDV